MQQMFDTTWVCDAKQLPCSSFQITLQMTALKHGAYLEGALVLGIWGIYSYTVGICEMRIFEVQYSYQNKTKQRDYNPPTSKRFTE